MWWLSARRPQGRTRHEGDAVPDISHCRDGPGQGCGAFDRRPLLGATRGASIGHISPEAMEGGPIAVVNEGDLISINIPEGRLDIMISQQELKERLEKWKAPEPKVKHGYLGRYARLVTSASTGAVLK